MRDAEEQSLRCACGGGQRCQETPDPAREVHLRRGLRLEYLTVGWNVVEGVVSVAAALAAGSVALLGFGRGLREWRCSEPGCGHGHARHARPVGLSHPVARDALGHTRSSLTGCL